ncbi:MAG: BTAD domain-containing putative transcriptional regulator [Acidimicrobiia bacterium]
MKFDVLGPLTVTEGTSTLNIGGPKQRTVLAMLIARAGASVSADVLVDAVYGEQAGPRSRRTIQTFVSTLRGEVGDVIEKSGGGWRLNAPRSDVDAFAFEDLVAVAGEAIDGSPDRAGKLLREALALWNGHPYSDVEAHGHLDAENSRLAELRVSAQSLRLDADLAAGRHGDLVAEIEALLIEHPYQEHFRAQHMTALYRAGRQREALASCRQMRELLAEELGIDPSAELQDLEQRILEQDPALLETASTTIQRKAVLVSDPGDPIEIARLEARERENLVARSYEVVSSAIRSHEGAVTYQAGTATYALFDEPAQAAQVAESVVLKLDGSGLRMAIEWGDVEVGDGGASGPPITRAARLVGVAHRGQVLLSADAQHALSTAGGPGLRFETLGSHKLAGLEDRTAVYQLLVGDPPKKFDGLVTDRLPPPLPGAGHRSVPGYELREPIGRGSVGELYSAYQPSVGRHVIVEVIGRSVASDPDFVHRFEADVQRLWLLDHPNINPIVDYWRDPEGAFIVYRAHRGGVLDVAEVESPGRLVSQVGSALAYAHSYGMVHGSLAPDRVLLDESGNAYVIGFPIAGVNPPLGDFPEFSAPESSGLQADLFALGMLAHEVFTGGRVAADEPVSSDDPTIRRALAEGSGARFETISDFLIDLNPDDSPSPESRYTETRNPYKGLAAFHESDARDFFGRGDLTSQLVERLANESFLAVVGPSGSGKSSVVRAGLIPAVRRGDIEGSETWLVTDMLPGSHPFLELRRAMERVAVEMPAAVRDALAAERPDALQHVGGVLPSGSSLLLLVDQFEELFTLVDDKTRSKFIDLLSVSVANGYARVVITLRADFLDRPLAFSELSDLFDQRMVTVGSPSEDELREAIIGPANSVGVEVDRGMTERIVNEVHDRPGALPLLQHTLSELFIGRESDLLEVDAYEQIGGVSGSLGNRAERTFADLDESARAVAKQLLLRLVAVTDDSAPTRRRVRISTLDGLDGEVVLDSFTKARLLVVDSDPDTRTPTVEVAHEALLTHWPRLSGWIESTREDLTLAHRFEEAMQEWQRNDRDDAYLLTGARLAQHRTWTSTSSLKLTEDGNEFLALSAKRDERQRARRRRRRNWITGGFAIAAVIATLFGTFALSEADRADEAADEAETNAQLALDAASRANAGEARAEDAAALAKARELAASAVSVRETGPELATLLAIEAFDAAPPGTGLFPEAMIALRQAIEANRLVGRIETSFAGDVAFLPDETGLLLVDSGENAVRRYEMDDYDDHTWEFRDLSAEEAVGDVTIHPTRDLAAVATLVGNDDAGVSRVILLDTITGDLIGEIDPGECIEVRFGAFSFSLDGSVLSVPLEAPDCAPGPEWAGQAFYDTTTWAEVNRFDLADVTMTADMSRILVDPHDGSPAELLTFPDLELVDTFDIDLGSGGVRGLSPDGATIVYRVGNEIDFRPGFWDVETNSFIGYGDSFDGFFVPPSEVAFKQEGESTLMLIPSTESDGLYDVATGVKILDLPTTFTLNASISPDGQFAATANSGEVLVWEIGERSRGRSLAQDGSDIFWLNPDTIDVNGPRTTVIGFDGIARSPHPETGQLVTFQYTSVADLDPETGEVLATRPAHAHAQLADGRIALVPVTLGSPDDAYDDLIGPLTIWDPDTDEEWVLQDCQVTTEEFIDVLGGPGIALGADCPDGSAFSAIAVAVSADGRQLATISAHPAVVDPGRDHRYLIDIWDLETLELSHNIEGELDSILYHDPTRILHFGDGWIALYDGIAGAGPVSQIDIVDSSTGEVMAELQEDAPYRESFEVSPDGSSIFLIDESGLIFEYDTATWELARSWQGLDGRPRGLAVRDDGRLLGASGENEVITIWDLEPENPVLVDRIPMGTWISDITWIDDGRMGAGLVYPSAFSAEWRVVDLDNDAVVDAARASLIRDFTVEECRTYGIERCDASN